MSILDARAQLVCNIGPIISGSLSDDHQQGRGIIRTQGSLLLSGLFSPALGSVVNLAYVDASGNRLARFPRATLRVISSYADPFTRQTTVEVGCLMTYLGNRSGRISMIEGLYSSYLQSRSKRALKRINGQTLLASLVSTLGLTLNTTTLLGRNIYYDIEELQGETQNYVELLDKLLNTHNYSSYINDQETLVIYPLFAQLNGPRLTFDSFIDVAATSAGEEPGQVAVARGTYLAIPEDREQKRLTSRRASQNTTQQQAQSVVTNSPFQPTSNPAVPAAPVTSGSLANSALGQSAPAGANGSEQSSTDTWRESESSNTGVVLLTGETKEGQLYSYSLSYTEISKTTEIYNADGVIESRQSVDTRPLVRVNSQLVEDYIKSNQGRLPTFANQSLQRISREDFVYSVTQDGLGQNQYTLERKVNQTFVSPVEMAGAMGVPDYEWFDFTIPGGQFLSEKVETTYVTTRAGTKEVVRTYRCFGATQVGQQGLGKALQEIKRPVLSANYSPAGTTYVYGYLDIQVYFARYVPLVLDSIRTNKQTQQQDPTTLDVEQERRPYVGVTKQATTAIPASSAGIPGLTAGAVNTVKEFRLPLEPADEQATPTSPVIKSGVEEIAQDFAGVQNRLLYGHRLGRQFVTTLGVLPLYPYQAFHVEYNGVVASYRVNGTSFAFDQTQCLVSTDALYAGVAGGGSIGGANWVPLPPGATQLPPVPATTNNGAQVTANSAALASPINSANQASVNALIAALPSGQTQGFQYTSAPSAVLAPFVTTELVSGAVRLPLTVKTFNTVQTQLRTSFVARIKITGISGDPAIAPIRLPLELVELPSANNIATPVTVVAGMVATGPFTAVQSPVQVVAEVA